MTAAPDSKRFLITNEETLEEFLEKIKTLASWGGIKEDKEYEKGKFYIEIELSSEWFVSKDQHERSLGYVKDFNGSQ